MTDEELAHVFDQKRAERIAHAMTKHPHRINIATLEGTMRAERDDWVIRGVKGEIYPCKPDIFGMTYEAAKPLRFLLTRDARKPRDKG